MLLINTKAIVDNCSRLQGLITAKWLDLHTINNGSDLQPNPTGIINFTIQCKTLIIIIANCFIQIEVI